MSEEFLKELYKVAFMQGYDAKNICGSLGKGKITDENYYKAVMDAVINSSKPKEQ